METGKLSYPGSRSTCDSRCSHNDQHIPRMASDHELRSHPRVTRRLRRVPSMRLNVLRYSTMMIILLICLIRTTNARSYSGAISLDLSTELIYDRSEPPPRPGLFHAKRQEEDCGCTMTSSSSTLQTRTKSSSSSASLSSPTLEVSPLPHPFDSNLGNNFTSPTCPNFFRTFLNNESFVSCLPLSLLLKTSSAFFSAQSSPAYLTQTLDATCNVNFAQCSALMSSLADQIKLDNNCGADYRLQNPMVQTAYSGFLAYAPLYHAGCMTDESTGAYCYAEAVTNTTSSSGSYVYYLPLGIAMPGGAQPSCNRCLKQTMAVFASAATNGTIPGFSENYTSAAEQLNLFCGPTFAQSSVKTSAAHISMEPPKLIILTSLVSLLSFWILL